jgi:glycosyltransferase involved in cell wall biosynthesis
VIEGYDIICFSNDWDGDPLSKKHIMKRLARKNRVLWVNSIGNRNPTISKSDLTRVFRKLKAFFMGPRRVSEGIHVISPLAIPFHGSALARRLNQWLLVATLRSAIRKLGFRKRVTWTFLPTSANVAGYLGEKLVIYHCTDEFSEFSGTSKNAILDMEQRLIAKANCVFVSAERLLRNKAQHNPNTFLIRHGVDVEHFRKACDGNTRIPEDIARIPSPIIGFFGLIADWVDLQLVAEMARARPSWSFVLVGKVVTDLSPVEHIHNIHILGQKPYEDLPGYCRAFDAAILPFVINELTLNANPLKLREYLAAGLPVVSTPIPEVRELEPLVQIGCSCAEFIDHLECALLEEESGTRLAVSLEMDRESWDERVEEMSRAIVRIAPSISAPGEV